MNALVIGSWVVFAGTVVVVFALTAVIAITKPTFKRLTDDDPRWHQRVKATAYALFAMMGSGLLALVVTAVGLQLGWRA